MDWAPILGHVGPGVGGAIATLWAVRQFVIRPLRGENAAWREELARQNEAYRELTTNHMTGMTAAQHDTASILRDLVAKVSKINGKMG